MKIPEVWTAYYEKIFLDGLGTGKWTTALVSSRKELLKNYIKSLSLRKKWGGMDKAEVLAYAQKLLKEEEDG